VKHRAKANELIESGAVRVNKIKVTKTSCPVKPGDVLTLTIGQQVNVVKVLAEPQRRGSAALAREVYEVVGE
jgi:ribosome-associated heat shock protein Hsp15